MGLLVFPVGQVLRKSSGEFRTTSPFGVGSNQRHDNEFNEADLLSERRVLRNPR